MECTWLGLLRPVLHVIHGFLQTKVDKAWNEIRKRVTYQHIFSFSNFECLNFILSFIRYRKWKRFLKKILHEKKQFQLLYFFKLLNKKIIFKFKYIWIDLLSIVITLIRQMS